MVIKLFASPLYGSRTIIQITDTTAKEIAAGKKKTVLKNLVKKWLEFRSSAINNEVRTISGFTIIE